MDGNLEELSLDAEDTRQRQGRGLAPSPSVPPPMAIATTVHCTERSGERAGFWLTPEPHLTPQGNRCRHPPWRGFPLDIAMTALAPAGGVGDGKECSVWDGTKARYGLFIWNRCTSGAFHLILRVLVRGSDHHLARSREGREGFRLGEIHGLRVLRMRRYCIGKY